MKRLAPALLLILTGCASGDQAVTAPNAGPPSDARVAEIQVTLTELLERIDVLNARMARLEAGAEAALDASSSAATASPTPAVRSTETRRQPAATRPLPAGAQIAESYRAALVLYGKGRNDESRNAFQQVFDADPSGELADNALFWIGETHYTAGDYVNAVRFYRRVVTEYPDQNKAPDALFKIALAHEKTGDLVLARSSFQELVEKYPYSPNAASAKLELKRIKY